MRPLQSVAEPFILLWCDWVELLSQSAAHTHTQEGTQEHGRHTVAKQR